VVNHAVVVTAILGLTLQ